MRRKLGDEEFSTSDEVIARKYYAAAVILKHKGLVGKDPCTPYWKLTEQ